MVHESREVGVVVRYTHYPDATPEQCVEVMRWYRDLAEADGEAARLNAVRSNDKVEYFVKILSEVPGA